MPAHRKDLTAAVNAALLGHRAKRSGRAAPFRYAALVSCALVPACVVTTSGRTARTATASARASATGPWSPGEPSANATTYGPGSGAASTTAAPTAATSTANGTDAADLDGPANRSGAANRTDAARTATADPTSTTGRTDTADGMYDSKGFLIRRTDPPGTVYKQLARPIDRRELASLVGSSLEHVKQWLKQRGHIGEVRVTRLAQEDTRCARDAVCVISPQGGVGATEMITLYLNGKFEIAPPPP